jgi:hypothetical protein
MERTVIATSQSAAALHARLQAGTRDARQRRAARPAPAASRPRRVDDRAAWQLLAELRGTTTATDPSLSYDRALRRVLAALVAGDDRPEVPLQLEPCSGPVLVVRSGPWPLLEALLSTLAPHAHAEIWVLCHRRDEGMLLDTAHKVGVTVRPLCYPRFEPFNPVTLSRVVEGARTPWTAAFVLDGSRTGTGRAVEHVTGALASVKGPTFTWNGAGALYRARSLRDTLGRERYEIVRQLLRWSAAQVDRPR